MDLRRIDPISWYVGLVSSLGLCLFAALIFTGGGGIPRISLPIVLLGLVVLPSELLTIKIPRRGEEEEITTSTTFVYALLLVGGVWLTVIAQAVASVITDAILGKPLWKTAFNVAQYTISIAAAGMTLSVFSGVPREGAIPFVAADLPAILAAAVVFFLTNNTLAGSALALAQKIPARAYLKRDFGFQASTNGLLLAMAPLVVGAAEFNLALLPLFALPLIAIHRGGKQAVLSEHRALHDSLTDLPNRTLYRDRVQQALELAQRDSVRLAVMIMDIDRFKEINDTLGHHCGDELLVEVAARLKSILRDSDSVARLGGDEFAILLPGFAAASAAETVPRKILQSLEEPFMLRDLTLSVGASIGVALFPEHGEDVDTLMQRADVAMYVAKDSHSGYQIYSARQDRHSRSRLELASDLRSAIQDFSLTLVYQPKTSIFSGDVVGVEALSRWNHPVLGQVPPDEFIQLVEQTGLIRLFTMHVLDQALQQCGRWQLEGHALNVAVNLSMRSLLDLKFPRDMSNLLTKWKIDPGMLTLEITEGTIMADSARAIKVVRELDAAGVRLSIDDFGTGYSSLSYLKRLPVDEVKIDKSFVLGMTKDENDFIIVRSTIDLGRNLGLDVVAEGVENEEILKHLSSLGCDIAQGFHISRPLPTEEFTDWIMERKQVAMLSAAAID